MTRFTQKKEGEFLAALEETANVLLACEKIGYTRQAMYARRRKDEEFAKKWEQAMEIGIEALEDEAIRRAHQGVPEPVFYRGKIAGHVQKYSDTLLIFLLKNRKPKIYGDKIKQEVVGKDEAPLFPSEAGLMKDFELARSIAFLLHNGARAKNELEEMGIDVSKGD